MRTTLPKLVLLPGLDGTGKLFKDFIATLPQESECEVITYPANECLGYAQLARKVRSALSNTGPSVLIAESFSTPLAIYLAAERPKYLKALILCAGFASSPLPGLSRSICSKLALMLFRVPVPDPVLKFILLGLDAPSTLLDEVRETISLVQPEVLASRVRNVLECDVREELAQIDIPILYIRAAQDRLVGARCLEEITRMNPSTVVTPIDGPHLILQRRPKEASDAITRFVLEIES